MIRQEDRQTALSGGSGLPSTRSFIACP